jgi:hypothetical protein
VQVVPVQAKQAGVIPYLALLRLLVVVVVAQHRQMMDLLAAQEVELDMQVVLLVPGPHLRDLQVELEALQLEG